MIPKTIHYCWFGRGRKPRQIRKCIRSWKKHLPDYQIMEWNEDNYDISSAPIFVKQALEAKKWAFASDYIRYDVVYRHGGFYFDTDVEVLKNPDFLRENRAFFALQYDNLVASGLGFGAEKGAPVLLELMDAYQHTPFLLPDGQYDKTPCPKRDSPVFIRHGYLQDGREQIIDGEIHIYPAEYFCPSDLYERKPDITANTVAIHRFTLSWSPRGLRWRVRLTRVLGKRRFERLKSAVGTRRYESLKRLLNGKR